jgi:PhnB protein
MAQLIPYLSFSGNCREALHFYQSCFGGELNLMRFADSPMASHLPAEAQEAIIHGTLTTPTFLIQASDAGSFRGPLTLGNQVAIAVDCASEEEIDTLFAQLSEGGTVVDPLANMFWGGKFGALTDRFGIKWLFNYQRSAGE